MGLLFTGTFDDSKIGDNTADNLLKPVQTWLRHQTERKGLAYVLVAEYSPLNHRIHFHGLLNSALDFADSGTVLCSGKSRPIKVSTADKQKIPQELRKTVYNIPAWSERFGFTTAIPVTGEPVQLARYITNTSLRTAKRFSGSTSGAVVTLFVTLKLYLQIPMILTVFRRKSILFPGAISA